MSFPDIPVGMKLPLVDDTTNRLPDPTMDAIAASPELSATIDAGGAFQADDRRAAALVTRSVSAGIRRAATSEPLPPTLTASTVNGGQDVHVSIPEGFAWDVAVPLVIWCHGQGSDVVTSPGAETYRQAVLDAGYAFAACDFHGDNYGSPAALSDLRAVYEYALNLIPISGVVVIGGSMGGVLALNAITHNALPNLLGCYLTMPITNLRARYDADATARGMIRAAYGIAPDGSDYATKTEGYDPVLRNGGEFRRVPVHIVASPDDTVAPSEDHADAIEAILDGYSVVTRSAATGPHGDLSLFDPAPLLSRLEDWTGGAIDTMPAPDTTTGLWTKLLTPASGFVSGSAIASGWPKDSGSSNWALTSVHPTGSRQPVYQSAYNGKTAVVFTAANQQYVTQAEGAATDLPRPMSVTVVVRATTTHLGCIFTGAYVSSVGKWITLLFNSDGTIIMGAAGATGVSYPYTAGVWYKITVTVDETGAATLYVDGVRVRSVSGFNGVNALLPRLMLGATADAAAQFLDGAINQVWVHERTLTSADVSALHALL